MPPPTGAGRPAPGDAASPERHRFAPGSVRARAEGESPGPKEERCPDLAGGWKGCGHGAAGGRFAGGGCPGGHVAVPGHPLPAWQRGNRGQPAGRALAGLPRERRRILVRTRYRARSAAVKGAAVRGIPCSGGTVWRALHAGCARAGTSGTEAGSCWPDVLTSGRCWGVYVVGAIDPAERAFVGQQLATCPQCRAEFAGLARLPALLGRVTLDEVERAPAQAPPAVLPPERLLNSTLSEVTRLRRPRRRAQDRCPPPRAP